MTADTNPSFPGTPPGISLPSREWFDSHYHWAADVVGSWIGEETDIRAATIIDFGCGDGTTSLGVAHNFAPKGVIGVDIRDSFKNAALTARKMTAQRELPPNISFLQINPSERLADKLQADAVYSWSCFEHIERKYLPAIFQDIYELLPEGGLFFLQIEPLYFSPYGSHLAAYIEQPWQHLLVSEEELRAMVRNASPRAEVRANMRNSAVAVEQHRNFHLRQYSTLNRLTADEILETATGAGFTVRKEQRSRVDLAPPAALVEQHGADVLLTNEIRVLFKKGNTADDAAVSSANPFARALKSIRRILSGSPRKYR